MNTRKISASSEMICSRYSRILFLRSPIARSLAQPRRPPLSPQFDGWPDADYHSSFGIDYEK